MVPEECVIEADDVGIEWERAGLLQRIDTDRQQKQSVDRSRTNVFQYTAFTAYASHARVNRNNI